MNVLITGIAGLLGSRLADWIIKNTNFETHIRNKVIIYC